MAALVDGFHQGALISRNVKWNRPESAKPWHPDDLFSLKIAPAEDDRQYISQWMAFRGNISCPRTNNWTFNIPSSKWRRVSRREVLVLQ
jgi:hypothetical protein